MFTRRVVFTRRIVLMAILGILGIAATAPAQVTNEWSDDFQSAATYDSASALAPCYGGPSTKYTLIDFWSGDFRNERAVSGGGKLLVSARDLATAPTASGFPRSDFVIVGWAGFGLGCPGEPSLLRSTEEFTNNDVCIYGGVRFNPWQMQTGPRDGADGLPGVAGVDDDCDGTTDWQINECRSKGDVKVAATNGIDDDGDGTIDEPGELAPECDEGPAGHPIAGSGYGPPFPDGGMSSCSNAPSDGLPGVGGIDDDGNGITDDIGETGWPGTDDPDDNQGGLEWDVFMRLKLHTTGGGGNDAQGGIFLSILPGLANPMMIREFVGVIGTLPAPDPIHEQTIVESSNEISSGFFQPNTHYNWVFCGSGTCFGAQLWIETNMANPNETLGPVIFTRFNRLAAPLVGYRNSPRMFQGTEPGIFVREAAWSTSSNFSHKFWVTEGDPMTADFTNGIFGYPSPSSDLDGDRDVDANDFFTFSDCFNGALNPPKGICANLDADLDDDGDVDPKDFLTFSNCFNGSLLRPKALCFPPDLTTCGGGQNAMGGGGNTLLAQSANQSELAQSATQPDPFIIDGMTPTEEFWYFYTPTCTGDATLALCDATGQGRSVDGIRFAFFDGTSEEARVVPAAVCGQSATVTVPVVAGQTVSLLVYRGAGAESLEGFTLSVTCGN